MTLESLGVTVGRLPNASRPCLGQPERMSQHALEIREASAAYSRFKDSVLDLSEGPTAVNVARNLTASRNLDAGAPAQDAPCAGTTRGNAQGVHD
jgi:hypothetical protein